MPKQKYKAVIPAIQSSISFARVGLLDETQMKGINLYNPDLGYPEKPHLFLEFYGTNAATIEQVEMSNVISDDFGASEF